MNSIKRRSGAQSQTSNSGTNRRYFVRGQNAVVAAIFFGAVFLLTGEIRSQQMSAGGSPSSQQCSDPRMAGTSVCPNQGDNSTNMFPAAQTGNPASGNVSAPNVNYSDAEQYRQNTGRTSGQAVEVPLPPEVLTDFQKFIVSTTGESLPVYGASLFREVPSTFAPLDMAPVPPDYVIGPGDELRVRAWGQVSIQANVRVDRSGEVYLPQVGQIHVAGIPFSSLDSHLRAAIGRVFRNFDLTVDVGQIRSIQVYVAGQARRPGVYTVSSLSTLVDTLFSSGGPSMQGTMRRIELRRNNGVVTEFDLYNLLIRGDKSKDAKLMSGDVIYIPPVGSQVAVIGSVRNPAIYELRADETLKELIAEAGGTSATTSQARISIERIDDHRERHAMEVVYDGIGLATQLTDGDLIRIFSIVPLYRKTVTLRGNIANPGRYAWHEGMRVSNLIPDRESLLTRNYWWKRAQLGLPAPEFEAMPGLNDMRQPGENRSLRIPLQVANNQDSSLQRDIQSDSEYRQGKMTTPAQSLTAQQRGGSSSVAASATTSQENSARRIGIQRLAPEIDWDYAVIERLDPNTLKSTLIPFDLGKLVMQHDSTQDMALEAGDAVTIFSEADINIPLAEQTRRITLDGEFMHAGVYTARQGETLRQLIERAGGLTPNAYLYGSEFTRESTRSFQQARIEEYVQDLGRRILRSNIAAAASADDLASSGATAMGSERELLSRLEQIKATGRIVLEFRPDSTGLDKVPELAMQDGDHFTVPFVPASVNVVGAVYNQNAFLYKPGQKLGVYLAQAGGPNRDADKKHAFVIRASGEVISSDREKGPWGGRFANLRMYPGDTVVVPDKTFKPSSMRQLAAWSQIISGLGLSAAAISAINK